MKRAPLLLAASFGVSVGLGAWALRALERKPESSTLALQARVTDNTREGNADDDLARRLRQLRRSQTGTALASGLLTALTALAQHDPARAVREAIALSDAEGRAEALHECLPLWLARDAEAARAYLLSQIGALPLELAEALTRDAAAHDPQLGLALAQQLHVGARPRAVHEVFVQWAGSNPKAAAEAAEQLLPADGQVRIIGEVARIWGEQTPDAAQRWAAALPSQALRREAMLPIVDSWAAKDPQSAAQALEVLADEGYKQRLVDRLASRWAERDPAAARGFIDKLSPPALREAGATALLGSLLERDPARAASWALELGGDAHSDVVEKTLTAWVARDPHAARDWVAQQSDHHGHRQLLALIEAREKQE